LLLQTQHKDEDWNNKITIYYRKKLK